MAQDAWLVLPPLLILLGLVGIVVPALPGTAFVLAGVAVWAVTTHTATAWVLLVLAVLVAAAGRVLQYLLPGQRMREAGVRTSTLVVALLLAVVGFFVVPVVGAVLGFVLGVWLVETGRGSSRGEAWVRTRHAVVAVAQSMGIELAAALVVAGLYVVGLLLG
ncbi:DUF456 domain-containing protein [Phycicoccus endophyticus]|uniref:DUF456 domain-containing protein n=1 Tax=Phycicoccus endophyticus TaxID=1690220 RepID=A0A7G9R4W7_9MICO|nr:DUF456 domain-containing protein [Phycicoccus endophyticus]NHI18571.1 DUF456 domain-containing protein [Phycicoccus endophyticus]QNN50642.1 DUF456 domain-containing protein [Phycicoccus endophyticus]GGL22730.1 hypothetical protein GCM10012283_01020 [Phycicoccus endophyticus]